MADIYSPKYSEKENFYSQIIYHSESAIVTGIVYDGGSIDSSSNNSNSTTQNNGQNIVYDGGEI